MAFTVFEFHALFENDLTITNSTGTALTLVASPPGNGMAITAILVSNQDSIGHVANLSLDGSTTDANIAATNIPPGAGHDGVTPTVDLLSTLPDSAKPLLLAVGTNLYVGLSDPVTGGFAVEVQTLGGTF